MQHIGKLKENIEKAETNEEAAGNDHRSLKE